MDKPLITQEHVSILESAFAGGALSLLFQGNMTWWKSLLIFTSGEICAFYCAGPIAGATGWNQGMIGLTIGFSAMFICGGAVAALTTFKNDPWKVLRSIPLLQAFIGKEKPD